jgi:hypothetical protein
MIHAPPSSTADVVNDVRVGAVLRLGHRKTRDDFAGKQRVQPAALLLRSSEVRKDFAIA